MRITDESKTRRSVVYLALSDPEAEQLRDALEELLTTKERGWHVHVHDAEYKRSITVYREDDPEMVI